MSALYATTPFGRRAMTLGLVTARLAAEKAEPGATVHKWTLFRQLTEAKRQLGLPDRALAVLHALLSFHQETTLVAGDDLIVFPSNRELALRANGMSIATLQRQLARLVEAGIVLRKDSPNGKRYARRGRDGAVHEAFGFDLTPLAARAEEFARLAAEEAARQARHRLMRERVTLLRRDIVKMLALLVEEAPDNPDWLGWHEQLRSVVSSLGRGSSTEALEAAAEALGPLADAVRKTAENLVFSKNMRCNDSQTEAHYQNQNTDQSDFEPAHKEQGATGEPDQGTDSAGAEEAASGERKPELLPLGLVMEACPDIRDYGPGGRINGPREFVEAARLVRSLLGVSPDAWRDAIAAMGEHHAAICIAYLLQRGEAIRFPGGYLRALTKQARDNALSLGQMLMSLIGARRKSAAGDGGTG